MLMLVRQFLALWVVVLLSFVSKNSFSATRTGEFYYIDLGAGKAVITSYDGSYEDTVTVPNTIDGLSVISISNTFKYSDVSKLTLPNSIGAIEQNAFQECVALSALTIPVNITNIQSYAFLGCTGLKTLTFSVGTNRISWGDGAFQGCTKLSQIEIPDRVREISEHLFDRCSSLSNVVVQGEFEKIGAYAFQNTTSLKNLVFQSNVMAVLHNTYPPEGFYGGPDIGSYREGAFEGSGLTNALFRGDVTTIESFAFRKMPNLRTIYFEGDVKNIGSNAFELCPSLETLVVGGGVDRLGSYLFKNSPSLTNIVFYGGVKTIGDLAFAGASQLRTLALPEGLVQIGERAFDGCSGLKELFLLCTNPPNWGPGAFRGCANLTIYYPADAPNWKNFNNYGNRPARPFQTNLTITWPMAESLRLGKKLADSSLTNGSAKFEGTTNQVPGTFAFADTNIQPPAGITAQSVIFTPGVWYLGEKTNPVSVQVYSNIPEIQVPNTLTYPVGKAFAYTIPATDSPRRFTIQGLPAEIQGDLTQGQISGVPAKVGSFPLRVTAQNDEAPPGSASLVLKFTKGTPVISGPPVGSDLRAGQPLAKSLLAGGTAVTDLGPTEGKFVWQVPDRRLPAGSHQPVVRFIPSDTANFRSVSFSIPLKILGITNNLAPTRLIQGNFTGEAYRVLANFEPTRIQVQGLPPGLSLDPKTRVVSGRPSQTGEFVATFIVFDETGPLAAQKTFTIVSPRLKNYLQQALAFLGMPSAVP